jgi:hypothetical protein
MKALFQKKFHPLFSLPAHSIRHKCTKFFSFFHFLLLARLIFLHFLPLSIFFFFFVGVKQKSKKFIIKNVLIHDMHHNELFFFFFFFSFLFLLCQETYFFILPGVKWKSEKKSIFSEGCTILFYFHFLPLKKCIFPHFNIFHFFLARGKTGK